MPQAADRRPADPPAFLTLAVMPFPGSITKGIGAGFLGVHGAEAARCRIRELHPLMLGASVAFLVYFALGG